MRRRDGVLAFPDLAALIAGARVYVGPDTSVTHLAAATGCPTVALLGPTDPRIWGPWPIGGLPVPWEMSGTIQRRGNVWIVQNPQPCLPCRLEGCERHISSVSRCLDELPIGAVMPAVDCSACRANGGGGRGRAEFRLAADPHAGFALFALEREFGLCHALIHALQRGLEDAERVVERLELVATELLHEILEPLVMNRKNFV